MITSIDELDLNEITFEKMRWQYRTLLSRSVGKRPEKQTYYTKGVKTPIGEIEESVWYELAEYMVQHEHEEELFNNLLQFETEATHNSCFDFKKLRQYTLELYANRIFNHPRWIGFISFYRTPRKAACTHGFFVSLQIVLFLFALYLKAVGHHEHREKKGKMNQPAC